MAKTRCNIRGSGYNIGAAINDIGAACYNIRGTMFTIIGTRDSNSSTILKLEGGSGINKKIN